MKSRSNEPDPTGRLNLLVAYPYLDRKIVDFVADHEDEIRLLIDSGAFTAWKSGKPIRLQHYQKFLSELPFSPFRYFTLDVIGDEKATAGNYETMRRCGFSPVPIFTRGADPASIDGYFETSDLVGIGGLVGTNDAKGYVNGIMKSVGDRRVHWLGFNALPFIARHRPYSCDSSTWSESVRFGKINVYLGAGKWKKVHRRDFDSRPPADVMRAIASFGIDPLRFRYADEWKNSSRNRNAVELVGYRSWMKYQVELGDRFGTMFFVACNAVEQVEGMLAAWRITKKKETRNAAT